MMSENSGSLFENLLKMRPIFKNRECLRPTYTPEELPHRENQIQQLAQIMVAPLRGETPSNAFLYGKTGTGKTATVNYISKELEKVGGKAPRKIVVVYLNCERVNTQYRIFAMLANISLDKMRKRYGSKYLASIGFPKEVPMTGWPTDQVYDCFFRVIDHEKQLFVIVLDEIDKLVLKSGDETLYNLTRINSDLKNARVTIVGISNDTNFMQYLDPRVLSSLSEEELVFPPYNAIQLKDILKKRAEMGFVDGAIDDGVIGLCAAYAAQEHGDARRALDLLRAAGELAEREGSERVTSENVVQAVRKIEHDKILEVIRTLPTQSKLVLYSIVLLKERGIRKIITGDVHTVYCALCSQTNLDALTQRRVSDLISELDMLGIISTKIISKGRYGRTKEIGLNVQPVQARAVIQQDYYIGDLNVLTIPHQLTFS